MPRSRPQLPIVFLGPSLGHQEARKILDADYRRPIRRGDLGSVPANSIVAIVDGVFDQHLSVSPTEIRAALNRNILIFGSSSMGALRAVEVPGITGVGRVYEMYRTGAIDGDDEVALIFDPETMRPLCEPLVNIRHAVDRLARPGTISRPLATAIVSAARKLSYFDRTYPLILKEAGVTDTQQNSHLARMLASHDLKREDAITLLEMLRDVRGAKLRRDSRRPGADNGANRAAVSHEAPATDYVHCWEFGPPVLFSKVVEFMTLTGSLPAHAVIAQATLNRNTLPEFPAQDLVERHLAEAARTWHWATQEEVDTSLEDLGLQHEQIQKALAARAQLELAAIASVRSRSTEFFEALRTHLFFDDLALKRETARTISLDWLAARGKRSGDATAEEIARAKDKLCRLLNTRDVRGAVEIAGWWGVEVATVDQFIEKLALARRLAIRSEPVAASAKRHPWLRATKKAPGSKRFCKSLVEAYSTLKKLKPLVGITRVGVITGLGTIGIPNAQAFRPDGEWSSTVGSGKSESVTGAKVGAMMEEIEKWAQERFTSAEIESGDLAPRRYSKGVFDIKAAPGRRTPGRRPVTSSFRELVDDGKEAIDPSCLDLPYDSCYSETLPIEWHSCDDLITGSPILVPTAAITHRRVANDIYYSSRGGRKTITTNGLASGMTMTEALTHALCEYIERHALVLDSINDGNPGSPTAPRRLAVNLDTAPASTRRLLGKITRAGYRLEVREITSEIRVPTFNATIYLPEGSIEGKLFHDDLQRASGWAAHPDPETAINMSILEASQTIMTHVAGAREDLVLQARSLGRHERTDSRRSAAFARELDYDAPQRNFADLAGLSSEDAAEDVRWILKQIAAAGYWHAIVADYSTPEIEPVRVVRAIIPGLETINPFHTGVRARLAILSDLI